MDDSKSAHKNKIRNRLINPVLELKIGKCNLVISEVKRKHSGHRCTSDCNYRATIVRYKRNRRLILKSLVRKLYWFLSVPVATILNYCAQARPFFLRNYGEYVVGVMDGAFSIACLIILCIWIISDVTLEKRTEYGRPTMLVVRPTRAPRNRSTARHRYTRSI